MASSLVVDPDESTSETRTPQRPVAPRRRKLRERISLGHLFMIAAALLAFVLVVSVLQDRTLTVKVVVADQEILPGAAITTAMVDEIEIPAESALVDSLATIDMVSSGQTAAQRIGPGEPITLTALGAEATAAELRAMSLPIDRIDAVGGDIAPGDRVDVIAVDDESATYVAVDLEVLDTAGSDGGGGALSSPSLSSYYVTVAVDDETALGLARALGADAVSIIRSTGAEPVAAASIATAPLDGGAATAGPGTGSNDTNSNPESTGTSDEPDTADESEGADGG